MFHTVTLGRKVSKEEFVSRVPALRQGLLVQQVRLRDANFPVIVLFAGVDGAGKVETVNLLNEWMDPRHLVTRAYSEPSDEEAERPPFWRFWRDLPPRGRIGVFLSGWYSVPLVNHVRTGDDDTLNRVLDEIVEMEQMLVADGALILKFWMHLDQKAQKKRFARLEKDPLQAWRVTEQGRKNLDLYDQFVASAETIIHRTSTGTAPWHLVEGTDHRYRSLHVAGLLHAALEERLSKRVVVTAAEPPEVVDTMTPQEISPPSSDSRTLFDTLDLTVALEQPDYKRRLKTAQERLGLLHRKARALGISTMLVFEGMDAAGKGGSIRRITSALDARDCQVIPIAAPTDEEHRHHYLWRFWRHLPRAGRLTVFDRSWYGRVLVERLEGYAKDDEWKRAFAEIRSFEGELTQHGIVLLKFWLHISPEEQLRRFEERKNTPWKAWKLTEEDWRNRARWTEYERAAHDMIERTSTRNAPWIVVEGVDKRFARVKTIEAVCERLEAAVNAASPEPVAVEVPAPARSAKSNGGRSSKRPNGKKSNGKSS